MTNVVIIPHWIVGTPQLYELIGEHLLRSGNVYLAPPPLPLHWRPRKLPIDGASYRRRQVNRRKRR